MRSQLRHTLVVAASVLSCLLFEPREAHSARQFLDLPFDDTDVQILQGWFYSTDGPFECLGKWEGNGVSHLF